MNEQAQPIFRDPKRYPDMADPNLHKDFPEKDLNQAVAIAAMCLQEEPAARPLMSDVVTALSFLSTATPEGGAGENDRRGSSGEDSSSDEDNGTANNQVSAKYQESEDASETEYDYYENENQHNYSPQDSKEAREFYSKSSRKSSTESKNGIASSSRRSSSNSDSEQGRVSNGRKSRKSRKKKSSLNQRSSKKASLKQKSSKKSSVKVLSNKESGSSNSSSSHDGGDVIERSGSRPSEGNISIGLISSESVYSDYDSSIRSKERSSKHLDHTKSRES